MGILAWIIFGALAGWIASILMGENNRLGWFGNIVVGIVGAFIGAWFSRLLGIGEGQIDFDLGSLLLAIAGACALLFAVNLLAQNRPRV
jgi:uncharacterized membrane protein YeaQ/YmgE (transglycosylase-associated protein family)